MRYKIKLWDRRELVVNQKIGEAVILAKEQKMELIKVRGALYEVRGISYIEPIKEEAVTNLLSEPSNPVKKETLDKVKQELVKKFNWSV